MPVAGLKAVMQKTQSRFKHLKPDGKIERYLVTDGREIQLTSDTDEIAEFSKHCDGAFALVVDIASARQEVVEALNRSAKE